MFRYKHPGLYFYNNNIIWHSFANISCFDKLCCDFYYRCQSINLLDRRNVTVLSFNGAVISDSTDSSSESGSKMTHNTNYR